MFSARHYLYMKAEREGFEPPDLLQSTVFKTAAIDHSAISPFAKLAKKTISRCIFEKKYMPNNQKDMCFYF